MVIYCVSNFCFLCIHLSDNWFCQLSEIKIIFCQILGGILQQIEQNKQNREQVTQAYFELWAIEVGIRDEKWLSANFEIFFTYFNMSSITAI